MAQSSTRISSATSVCFDLLRPELPDWTSQLIEDMVQGNGAVRRSIPASRRHSDRSSWHSIRKSYGQGLADNDRCARARTAGDSDDDVTRALSVFK